jgi:hypothetical protein
MEDSGDETLRSPTYRKVTSDKKDLMQRLKQCLHGYKLQDLELDFIGTQFFTDIYLIDCVLGAGSFGVVLKVIERSTGNEYAMKVNLSINT